jgi:hypothetical protein
MQHHENIEYISDGVAIAGYLKGLGFTKELVIPENAMTFWYALFRKG